MIPNVMLYVHLFVNLPNVTLHVKNLRMLYVMLNVKSLIVKLCALIKHVKWMIVPNVLLFVKNPIASPIAKYLNLNVKLSVKNLNVTGSARSLNALSPNVNLYVKTLTVELKLNVVLAIPVVPLLTLVCPFSKKVKRMISVVIVRQRLLPLIP